MTPSLEGWPTKAKEAPSPHEVRLAPLDTKPVFQSLGDKTYWSVLKFFYNDTKVQLIPLLLVNNKIVSDFIKKANLFNDFFAAQCKLFTKSSVLLSTIFFKTHSRLNSISFKKKNILKIAHSHDDISI